MNPFVADPEWGWWIVWYFFLGGVAAGAYFTATLVDFLGRPEDRELVRAGYRLAFPLVSVCGILLILDLNRPERFWHMLVKSQVVYEALAEGWPWSGRGWGVMAGAPLFKPWSPMSVGSWALLLFGLCGGLSFLGSLWPDGRLDRGLRRGVFGRGLQLLGCAVGFFVAAYTGTLLTATNQPVWGDSTLIAPLFLASSASTGTAAVYLLAFRRRRSREPSETPAAPVPLGPRDLPADRLHRAEQFSLVVEGFLILALLASLGSWVEPAFYHTKYGRSILLVVVGGVLLPFVLHAVWRRTRKKWELPAAALLVLLGGFLLRYGVLMAAPEALSARPYVDAQNVVGSPAGPAWSPVLSPEDGRQPGDPGADPGNRPVVPRSKVFDEP